VYCLSENDGDFTKNEGENRWMVRDGGGEVATDLQGCSAQFTRK